MGFPTKANSSTQGHERGISTSPPLSLKPMDFSRGETVEWTVRIRACSLFAAPPTRLYAKKNSSGILSPSSSSGANASPLRPAARRRARRSPRAGAVCSAWVATP